MEEATNQPVTFGTPPVPEEAVLSRGGAAPEDHPSAWAPLREPIFRNLWLANFVSNIGSWMHGVAAPWLMATLVTDPHARTLLVALVQSATSLSMCLVVLPAGALADIVDRRRLLIFTQTWMLLAAGILGALTLLDVHLVPPWVLLLFTFLLGLGGAMNAPAWLAAIPEMVPRREMPAAVVLNSVGFNLALAIGPALGGQIMALVGQDVAGAGTVFTLNALSFLGVVAVLFRWRRPVHTSVLPTERILRAMRVGVRYVRHSPPLQTVLLRAVGFIFFGSAFLTLLPVFAKDLNLSAFFYGILFGCFGLGAVAGATVIHRLSRRYGTDALVVVATLAFALALAMLALLTFFPLLCVATALGGMAWMALMGTYMVAAQTVVPSWVRARALAVFMVAFQGGMTVASVLWGTVAQELTTQTAFALAALGVVLSIPLMWRWRLTGGEGLDLTPAGHWPAHQGVDDPEHEEGPVLIVVEYRIDPARAQEFRQAMRPVRLSRLRDGAMRWGLFQATDNPTRYLETFLVESWIEHLRQHERLTVTDRAAEERVRAFHLGPEPPAVSHYIAAPPDA